jgi:Phage integrase family
MAWKPTGRPTVRQQRGKWVVRVDGIDTETGHHRPRQLGTFTSRRAAQKAATSFAADGTVGPDRDTVRHLVDAWVASRVDVSPKTRLQYEWRRRTSGWASARSGLTGSSARTWPAGSMSLPREGSCRAAASRSSGWCCERPSPTPLRSGICVAARPLVSARHGNPVSPGNFDQTLERLVLAAGVPRLTSHGLRHTAATHMVRHAADVGEIRAAPDLLGHSPDMLMKVYTHALPESVRTVTDRIAQRAEPAGSRDGARAPGNRRPRGAT